MVSTEEDEEQEAKILTFSGSKSPGIEVPSLEQKQYGNSHLAWSHFSARSTGVSVDGAGAERSSRIGN